MSHPVELWLAKVQAHTDRIAAAHPKLAEQTDYLAHLATLTAIALPQAENYTDPGDGLRSPALTGSTHGGGVSDPTGTVASSRADATDTRQAGTHAPLAASAKARAALLVALALDDLADARRHAVEGYGQLLKILRPVNVDAMREQARPDDPGCLAHRKAGAPYRASGPVKGACRWCYDFQRQHGRIPPAELVHHHDAGYPLSPTMLAQAMAKKSAKKGKTKNGWNTPTIPPKRHAPTRRSRMLDRVREAALRMGVSQ